MEKTLTLGKIEGKRRRRQQRMRWLDGITDSMDMNLGKLREIVRDREARCVLQSRGLQRVRHNLTTEHLQQQSYYMLQILQRRGRSSEPLSLTKGPPAAPASAAETQAQLAGRLLVRKPLERLPDAKAWTPKSALVYLDSSSLSHPSLELCRCWEVGVHIGSPPTINSFQEGWVGMGVGFFRRNFGFHSKWHDRKLIHQIKT